MATKLVPQSAQKYLPKSAQAYQQELEKMEQLIADIQKGIKMHVAEFKKDNRNWGYYGDLDHYNEYLSEIADSLHHRGEYAN